MIARGILIGATLMLAGIGPVWAGGQTTQLAVTPGPLARGGAPLPEFHLNFLLEDPVRQPPAAQTGADNLEIALSAPDSGVFRFLFSPRPQLGLSLDRATGSNRGYAGLTWNLFDSDTVYGNFGLAGTYDPGSGAPNDPLRRPLGPPLMLHGAIEFGYHLGDQHSLSLSLDQGRAADFRGSSEADNLHLRYGLKF